MKTYTTKELKEIGLTLRSLAEKAGFHFTTVEKAIKGFPRVSPNTRRKIFETVEEYRQSHNKKIALSDRRAKTHQGMPYLLSNRQTKPTFQGKPVRKRKI